MISNSLIGQDINGKWVLKDIDSGDGKKGYPGFQLLDIKNDSINFYTDFSLNRKATTLKISDENLLNYNNEIDSKYKIIDSNHIKWFANGKSNDKDVVFECDFYRLQPTLTTLKKEEIEKLTFEFTKNGRTSKFEFNKELWDSERLKFLKLKEGEKYLIEKIDDTFFVSMYYNGKRSASIPIKEVTTKFLKLYAYPNEPMEVTAYRKK